MNCQWSQHNVVPIAMKIHASVLVMCLPLNIIKMRIVTSNTLYLGQALKSHLAGQPCWIRAGTMKLITMYFMYVHSKPPYSFFVVKTIVWWLGRPALSFLLPPKGGILPHIRRIRMLASSYMGNILLPKSARDNFIYEILLFTTILCPLSNAHVSESQCTQCKQEILWRLSLRDLPPFGCARGSGNKKL